MVRLFLDTDFGPDCDDVGALQLIHALCDRGEARLLGVTHCTGNPYGLPAISALNRFNGREVPLGTAACGGFLADMQKYNRAMSEQFPHEFEDGQAQRPAVEVFREVMAAQEDGSVTMCAIGPMNNLRDYLEDERCLALIRSKVIQLVAMACRFDGSGRPEWNVEMDVEAARKVVHDWPTPVAFCPWECGQPVLTGGFLRGLEENPVKTAYRLWTDGGMERSSYDLLAVYFAVRGADGLMKLSGNGRVKVRENGESVFEPAPDAGRAYTINALPPEEMAGRLNDLLLKSLAARK